MYACFDLKQINSLEYLFDDGARVTSSDVPSVECTYYFISNAFNWISHLKVVVFKNLTLISFFCDALVGKFDNDSHQTQHLSRKSLPHLDVPKKRQC